MKSTQARGRTAIEAELAEIKRRMVEARRREDDEEAKRLSQRKAQLLRKLRPICPICGVPIAAGASACRLHARRPQPLALPAGLRPASGTRPRKKTSRIGIRNESSVLPDVGWYLPTVQKVIRRWENRVRPDWLERYACEIGEAMLNRLALTVSPAEDSHWALIAELIAALTVGLDRREPAFWLLRYSLGAAKDGVWPTWEEVAALIKHNGGPSFPAGGLRKTAQRLHLAASPTTSRAWRENFGHLAGTKAG